MAQEGPVRDVRKEILEIEPDKPYSVAMIIPTPEELTSAGEIVEAALTPAFGGDMSRAVAATLSNVGWSKCVGGWVPMAKAINMAQCMYGFPRNNCIVGFVHFGTTGKNAADQRNYGVAAALDRGVDYVWMQDWDVINPIDAFGHLFQADKDIISGVYWMKEYPPRTMAIVGDRLTFFDGWWKHHGKEIGGQTYEVGRIYGGDQLVVVPCGCLLVKSDVFRAIEPPWFKQGGGFLRDGYATDFTDDAYFCQKAKEAGYSLNLHTAVQCGHVDTNRGVEFGFNEATKQPAWRYVTEHEWRPWDYPEVTVDDAYIGHAENEAADDPGGEDGAPLAEFHPEPIPERSG